MKQERSSQAGARRKKIRSIGKSTCSSDKGCFQALPRREKIYHGFTSVQTVGRPGRGLTCSFPLCAFFEWLHASPQVNLLKTNGQ